MVNGSSKALDAQETIKFVLACDANTFEPAQEQVRFVLVHQASTTELLFTIFDVLHVFEYVYHRK